MATLEDARRALPDVRRKIRRLGGHMIDCGILRDRDEWVIEVSVARPVAAIPASGLMVRSVPVRVTSVDTPSRDERRASNRTFMANRLKAAAGRG